MEKDKFNVDNILHVFLVPNGDKKENAYILCDREECDGMDSATHSQSGALIDPGTNEYKLIRALEDYRVNITKIFITHAHEGHVKCIQELLHDIGDLTIYLNEADRPLFDSVVAKGLSAEDEVLAFVCFCLFLIDGNQILESYGRSGCGKSQRKGVSHAGTHAGLALLSLRELFVHWRHADVQQSGRDEFGGIGVGSEQRSEGV